MRKEGNIVYVDNETDLKQWFSGENLDSEYISSANNPLTFKITNSIVADHIINNGIHSNYTLDGQNNYIILSFDQLYNKSAFYGDNSTICNIHIYFDRMLLTSDEVISAAPRYNGTVYRWRILYAYCFSLNGGTINNVHLETTETPYFLWTTETISTSYDYISICAICNQISNIDYLIIGARNSAFQCVYGLNNTQTSRNYNYGALNNLTRNYPFFNNIPINHSYNRIGIEGIEINSREISSSNSATINYYFNDINTPLYIHNFYISGIIDSVQFSSYSYLRINTINGRIYNGWIGNSEPLNVPSGVGKILVYYTSSQYYSIGYVGADSNCYMYTDIDGVWYPISEHFPSNFLITHNWDTNVWEGNDPPWFKTSSYIYKLYDLYIKQNNILNKKNVYIKTNNILQLKEIQRKELSL